jgi:hypothetical protein
VSADRFPDSFGQSKSDCQLTHTALVEDASLHQRWHAKKVCLAAGYVRSSIERFEQRFPPVL